MVARGEAAPEGGRARADDRSQAGDARRRPPADRPRRRRTGADRAARAPPQHREPPPPPPPPRPPRSRRPAPARLARPGSAAAASWPASPSSAVVLVLGVVAGRAGRHRRLLVRRHHHDGTKPTEASNTAPGRWTRTRQHTDGRDRRRRRSALDRTRSPIAPTTPPGCAGCSRPDSRVRTATPRPETWTPPWPSTASSSTSSRTRSTSLNILDVKPGQRRRHGLGHVHDRQRRGLAPSEGSIGFHMSRVGQQLKIDAIAIQAG